MFVCNLERTFCKCSCTFISDHHQWMKATITVSFLLSPLTFTSESLVRKWNNRNVFSSSTQPHQGTSESDLSFNYDRDHPSDLCGEFLPPPRVCVCVCPPLYRQCAKLDRPQRDGAGLITRSHLNVGQQKVASEGKRIKVGFSPPPLFLFLFLMGVCFFGRVTWVLRLAAASR